MPALIRSGDTRDLLDSFAMCADSSSADKPSAASAGQSESSQGPNSRLAIEIGGTKLQLAVGRGERAEWEELTRMTVDPAQGGQGIRDQILAVAPSLIQKHRVASIGIGFGGPIDSTTGVITKSHQIDGWDDFPLSDWTADNLGIRPQVGNDCDVAALAEARWGAGRSHSSLFYVTVGTGIGGGLVFNGQLVGRSRPAVAEIGHLRPGPNAERSHQTVESLASGWGIASVCRVLALHLADQDQLMTEPDQQRWHFVSDLVWIDDAIQQSSLRLREDAQAIIARGDESASEALEFDAEQVAQWAADGNRIASLALATSAGVLGWAIAQAINLTAPQIVAVGGGVSLMDRSLFLDPLAESVARYVFAPLADSYQLLPAMLGEEVVLHGAIALTELNDKLGSQNCGHGFSAG